MSTVQFTQTSSWNTGFSGNLVITNSGSTINGWTLEFTAPFQITNLWNARIVSQQGGSGAPFRYVIRNESWNSVISSNGTVSFGFNANRMGTGSVQPTNFVLNGVALQTGTVTPTPPVTLPTLAINDISLAEGNSGTTTTAIFTVSLSRASTTTVRVDFATANSTALAGSDYTTTSGTLVFMPGETQKAVRVNVTGDGTVEPNERFFVRLSGVSSNATIADSEGIATLVNDDVVLPPPLPQLTINDISLVEGNSGTTAASFTVRLSAASSQTVSVNFATANDTATAGSDYTATSGIVTFAAGETSKTITVNVAGDVLNELNERFFVNLSNATNAQIGDAQGIATITNDDLAVQPAPGFNYGEALQKSIWFYEAQRSGRLPSTNRVSWRGDSALTDGADVGRDLTGGYYDAGDHVKFGFPMAASMTMLGWGAVQYRSQYQQSGQLPYILDALKWGTDYILKAHVTNADGTTREFWGQVGQGSTDHAYWGPAERMTMARPSFKIDRQKPGSDLAGEAAAALAVASIAFRGTDRAYSDRLLTNAIQLFQFADTYRGKYSDSIADGGAYYNSFSGFQDELVWAAVWLHKATKAAGTPNPTYLAKAESMYQGVSRGWTQSWDTKNYGAAILLAQETGNVRYRTDVESWLNFWSDKSGAGITYTAGGLAWLSQWGSLRYSANTAFLAGIYADTVNDPNSRYSNFAEDQIDYILGDNPNRRSYMVGFGNNSPKNPHHRGSHGSLTGSINDPVTNRNVLYGALVGGPSAANDNAYVDDRTNFITNEVALDYNAGLTGALARMYGEFGGTPLTNFANTALTALSSPTLTATV